MKRKGRACLGSEKRQMDHKLREEKRGDSLAVYVEPVFCPFSRSKQRSLHLVFFWTGKMPSISGVDVEFVDSSVVSRKGVEVDPKCKGVESGRHHCSLFHFR